MSAPSIHARLLTADEAAREYGCQVWAEWTGSTVTGYVYTCPRNCPPRDSWSAATPEGALVRAKHHAIRWHLVESPEEVEI